MVIGNVGRVRALLGVRTVIVAAGAAVMVLPFAYMLSTSFKPDRLVLEVPPQLLPHHATTANYVSAWGSNDFGRYFLNSVLVAVATTLAAVLLAAMMAYAFARFRFRGRVPLFGLLLLFFGLRMANASYRAYFRFRSGEAPPALEAQPRPAAGGASGK